MKKTLTEAEVARAIAALEDGQTTKEVCARFGVGWRVLSRLIGEERWAAIRELCRANKAGGTGKTITPNGWRKKRRETFNLRGHDEETKIYAPRVKRRR